MKNLDLTQLYWPAKQTSCEGFIVGWNIYNLICCIIDVIDDSIEEVQKRVACLSNKPAILGVVGA
jgi:hypothetical protein